MCQYPLFPVCDPLDRDPSLTGSGVGMATVCWWAYMIRFLDFFDTFFFILRKKFDHVNALQVIHHFLMPCYGWIIVRYI